MRALRIRIVRFLSIWLLFSNADAASVRGTVGRSRRDLKRKGAQMKNLECKTKRNRSQHMKECSSKKSSKASMKSCSSKKRPKSAKGYVYEAPYSPLRLLMREGVVDQIPSSLCQNKGKNVILVIGDGMGWEMVRAGAIAKSIIDELNESFGCDVKTGCPGNEQAKEAFVGRRLRHYYTEGKGHGLPWQDLEGFTLLTSSGVIAQGPNPGDFNLPNQSLLNGTVTEHGTGLAPLALDECGQPLDFSPLDYEDFGGNMILWNDDKGGKYPWDGGYFQNATNCNFDPEYITRHAPGSAPTATTFATGHKTGNYMLSVDLYENEVSTLFEEALGCEKAVGVVSSVPILHATPGAFVTHSNNRNNGDQIRRGFRKVNPTLASGVCYFVYYPFPEDIESMQSGALSSQWTFLHQQQGLKSDDFYDSVQDLDPDRGDHLLVCLAGKYSKSRNSNLPYRGVDGNYLGRYCSRGSLVRDASGEVIGVKPTTPDRLCNHFREDELDQMPHISKNVREALKFLGKDKDGFLLVYEQGDTDYAAHSNHMDDMIGAVLDVADSVQVIMDWIDENGGFEKNALYVTADHDHYLTLLQNFPEVLANYMIDGQSHLITPKNNSAMNAWDLAIKAGRHEDCSKTKTEHIKDFTTWTQEDIEKVGHYWGPFGSGGNGWSYHTTRPVPLSFMGDDGCIDAFEGKDFEVLGRRVEGCDGKIDQVHLHSCMYRALFGLK